MTNYMCLFVVEIVLEIVLDIVFDRSPPRPRGRGSRSRHAPGGTSLRTRGIIPTHVVLDGTTVIAQSTVAQVQRAQRRARPCGVGGCRPEREGHIHVVGVVCVCVCVVGVCRCLLLC